jgi:hypothetical protein
MILFERFADDSAPRRREAEARIQTPTQSSCAAQGMRAGLSNSDYRIRVQTTARKFATGNLAVVSTDGSTIWRGCSTPLSGFGLGTMVDIISRRFILLTLVVPRSSMLKRDAPRAMGRGAFVQALDTSPGPVDHPVSEESYPRAVLPPSQLIVYLRAR